MMNLPELNTFSYSVTILLSVILVKALISSFHIHEPLTFFRFYCDRLADKVSKTSSSKSQQSISGLVSIIVSLAPLLIIIWLFEAFVTVKWLWQSMLLYIAVGGFGLTSRTKNIAIALTANQKYLAKQTIQPLVLRDTSSLSNMGISKTCIEMQLLQTLQQGFIVCFYFLIAGPLAALTYRLLLEMHYSWNVKCERFAFFGAHCKQIVSILQWLPVRLFTLILLFGSLGKNFILFWRLIQKHILKLNNDVLLHCLALNLGIRLGGVAMYDGIKLRRTAFNDQAKQPEPSDIIYASRHIKQVLITSLTCLILSAVLLQSLN
ncbi:MAG: cobalamin biosynthesis protein [Alteromonadaceae bacterium]|nr:cobalamin biosynthesis protein [Alteromonadaceae bacterium]